MIDAATIGIRLALDDGVSEGITSIRRDLAALDRAVGGSSANLLRLRGLAETLGTLDFSRLSDTTRTAFAAVLPQLHPVSAPPVDAPPPFSSLDAPPRASISPVLPQATPRMSFAASEPRVPSPMVPRATARRSEETGLPRVRIAAVAPAHRRLPDFADFSPFDRVLAAAPIAASHAEVPSRLAAVPTAEPVAARASLAPLPLPLAATPPMPGGTVPPATWPARPPVAPIVDLAASVRSVPPPPMEATSPAGQHADNAPAEQSEVAEIHMDGHFLGRFVTDHLARSATRPPAGGTGFDPRLSPAWPGPASGL